MHRFEELIDQPLAVVFIDEVAGKERWRVTTGLVVSAKDGPAFLVPPSTLPAFQLRPEWEERLKPVPERMFDLFSADFAIYVYIGALPADANTTEFTFTGINLNS